MNTLFPSGKTGVNGDTGPSGEAMMQSGRDEAEVRGLFREKKYLPRPEIPPKTGEASQSQVKRVENEECWW